ncbi:MAG: cation diffusion facilitator family transporter [Methanobacteriota archaeon]
MKMEKRGKLGERAALVGVFGNVVLSAFKFIVGVVACSTAVIADALHSFSDIIASAVTWFGLRASRRPPDREHQYGHGDVEPLTGFVISIFLIILGLEFAKYAVGKIYTQPPIPKSIAIYATIFSIIFKELMSRYTIKIAKHIRSPALGADAQHHRSDVYSSLVVLVGIIGARNGYPFLDPAAGLLVAAVIVLIGFNVGKDNILQLMGTVSYPELNDKIEKFVSSMSGVKLIHRIKIHGIGAYFNVDLHVCVDENLPLSEAHKIAHEVQNKIKENFPEISYVLVHIEPYDTHHIANHRLFQ